MDELRERLLKKGWSQKEVEHTISVLASAKEKKSRFVFLLDEALIWIALLVTIFANFVLSVVIVPFLLMLSGTFLYFVILIFGVAFGLLFTFLLRSIEKIELTRHFLANVFIPIIGLINMYIIARISNKLILVLNLDVSEHSPALVSMVYVFAFLLPYLISQYFREFSAQKLRHGASAS